MLQATKVKASSLGPAMCMFVVQECHFWLCLADMRDADKVRFLSVPVSQTSLFGDAVENFTQQFSVEIKYILQLLPSHVRRPQPLSLLVAKGKQLPWSHSQGSHPAYPGPFQTWQ